MEKIAVSIIVPIYNTESYLRKCLESCVNQTLNEIEIICVNDASTDNSAVIVKEYLQHFPNKIRYFEFEQNLKTGKARNVGINEARGEYLCFVDSDDYIDLKLCEEVYSVAKREKSELVCYDSMSVKNGKEEYTQSFEKELENIWYAQPYTPCMGLVKRSFIIDNELFFPENITYEDKAIVPLWRCLAKNLIKLEKAYYYYVKREGSATNTFNLETRLKSLDSIKFRQKEMQEHGIEAKFKAACDKQHLYDISIVLQRVLKEKDEFTYDNIKLIRDGLSFLDNYQFDYSLAQFFMTQAEIEMVKAILYEPDQILAKYNTRIKFNEENRKQGYTSDVQLALLKCIEKYKNKYGNKLAVWGCGEKGIPCIASLISLKVPFEVFDNSNKEYVQFGEIRKKVYGINELKERADVVFVTSNKYYSSIEKQIRSQYWNICVVNLYTELVKIGERKIMYNKYD